MPWTQTNAVMERRKLMTALVTEKLMMVEACRRFGISRKTGYKIVARHAELGMTGLANASRATKTHPNLSSPEVEGAVLRVRKTHPTWLEEDLGHARS
jgi:transposase